VNQANSRSVVVRINDRGPSTRKSVLNLSRGSARAIGITGTGLVALHKLD
jgi:rare lipoprotein A